ncbi:MAG TPA: M48 family metallopeptidase [Anaeromyxobacteraceae bacterium]|nr:M48 family metallopeptidase [Anaeromyxobacteraceae bacterium]
MGQRFAGLVLVLLVVQYAIETWLLVLNLRRAAQAHGVPAPLAGRVDDATASRSRAYTLANGRFSLVTGAWGLALGLAVLYSGVLPWLDGALGRTGLSEANRFVAFLAILSAALSLADLPFSAWHTFVVEARFGFNRTRWRLWVSDRLKGFALAAALGIPFLYGVYGFMRFTGSLWWVWLFGFVSAYQLVLLWLWPSVIAPLFNRFRPLPEGELRARLEALARDAGFRNRGLYVMDASRRSGHSNAYFAGVVRPRVVLFDTLVTQMSVDEAASVLAHEIGHFRRRHVHRRLAVSLAGTLLALFVLSLLVPWAPLYAGFGFARPSLEAALALVSLGGGAFVFWLAPVASVLSRRHEYEADRYSVGLAKRPEALKSALVRLTGQNLSNLHPHPWYSAWHYSHPTLVERLAAIDREAAGGGLTATA